MDCSLPGSSVHGIFQARALEWGVIAFSDIIVLADSKSKRRSELYIHDIEERSLDLEVRKWVQIPAPPPLT